MAEVGAQVEAVVGMAGCAASARVNHGADDGTAVQASLVLNWQGKRKAKGV